MSTWREQFRTRELDEQRREDDKEYEILAGDVAKRQRSRVRHRHVKDVIGRIIAARGIAETETNSALNEAWANAVGERFSTRSQVGSIRRGVLHVTVDHSIVAQELSFQKKKIVETIQLRLPSAGIRDLRIRVGRLTNAK